MEKITLGETEKGACLEIRNGSQISILDVEGEKGPLEVCTRQRRRQFKKNEKYQTRRKKTSSKEEHPKKVCRTKSPPQDIGNQSSGPNFREHR